MTKATVTTFERKCAEGEWEAMTDTSRDGYVEVRNASTGKRFTVKVINK
jgi:hypothetical protein